MKTKLILISIIVLASLLRLVQLGKTPSSLYWEETALGYDAYSIWKTGKDFHNHPWPIVAFESFGDWKPSGYYYVTAPFVGIFGLNNWSVRLPSALAGILTVYLVYLISQELFHNSRISLLASLTLAIMPWHIQFSRTAFEVNVATMWLCLGILFQLKGKKFAIYYLPSVIGYVLSAYTYHGLRVLAPLIALFIFIQNFKTLWRSKWVYIAGIIGIVLMLPIVINIKTPQVAQRFAETSLFSTSTAVKDANTLRTADANTSLARIIHHRYILWGKEILAGMLSQFSPNFLFLNGDQNQRHETGYTALLYWWCILPLGFTFIVKNKQNNRSKYLLIAWIILATIPPALTNVTPHTLRFLPAAPAFAILIGYGLQVILFKLHQSRLPSYLATWLPGLIIISSSFFYLFDYYTAYQSRSAPDWQYGYQQVIQFIKTYPNPTIPVQVTRTYGRPSMYFLYYLSFDPRLIQAQATSLPKDQGELLAFDRYTFGPINMSKHSLIVNDQPLPIGKLLKTISFPNNIPAFYIYEI